MQTLKDIYHYREFLKNSIKKEIRGKYKASVLGLIWSFVNPLLSVLIYVIVFPHIINPGMDNYLAYLVCGIIPWNWVANSISYGTMAIIFNSNLIKKVYFPRIVLPLSVVTSGLVDFLISSLITILVVIISGAGITWHIVFFPLVTLVLYIFVLGIVFLTSAINTIVRDTVNIVNFFVGILFYLTPILYPLRVFKGLSVKLFNLNPFTHIIESYHDIFYYHRIPNLIGLGIVLLMGIILVLVGHKVFKKLERNFAENL